jgi:hypothetical protein
MHCDDALRQGLLGAVEPNWPTFKLHGSGPWRVDAGNDLGEGRLSGAILPDKAADATQRDREIDAAKRPDRGKAARQTFTPQQDAARARLSRGDGARWFSHELSRKRRYSPAAGRARRLRAAAGKT